MKYNKELTDKLIEDYNAGIPVDQISQNLDVPVRSVIAKLASLGVYKKKTYVNKNGEPPVKKEVYIEKLAELLHTDLELLDSLEKVNKRILQLLVDTLQDSVDQQKLGS